MQLEGAYLVESTKAVEYVDRKKIYFYRSLAGEPGVARDYQSRNPVYGVIF
jgi:hypothetical protein